MIEAQRYLQGRVVDGRFPLIQYLGGSGHSSVFLTECANTEHKRAAIKLIPAPPGNAQPLLTRWRLAARFSHPHLLRLYETGRCTLDKIDMLYVVMEYAEENLADTLIQRPLSPSEASDLLHPLLDVLGYIHGRGFVHGHVQPSNIMAIGNRLKLSSDRICHIGEFGDRRNGNAPYCAPECGSECLTPASDIWSLGVTIVECLTERMPESRGHRGAVSVPTDLPAPFLELARHCLSRSPHRRWDVAALKSRLKLSSFALKEAHADPLPAPVPAQRPARVVPGVAPASSSEPVAKPTRRFLALGATGVAVAAVVLGLAVLRPTSHAQLAPSHLVKIDATSVKSILPKQPVSSQSASKISTEPDPQPPRIGATIASSAPGNVVEAASIAPPSLHPAALAQGGVVHRVLPDVPRFAAGTIRGTVRVRVRVKVDPTGSVSASQLDSAGPSRYFDRLSMDAARDWKFRAPDGDAKAAPSRWLIRFDYTKSATTATAEPQSR
ncbi:MAG TPA: TonB family protein [Candidatus Acidoferrales bacterium]|jgi:TonB family protein|nr:TonB family protein [Candidatus Acidoferrales bacterium]